MFYGETIYLILFRGEEKKRDISDDVMGRFNEKRE